MHLQKSSDNTLVNTCIGQSRWLIFFDSCASVQTILQNQVILTTMQIVSEFISGPSAIKRAWDTKFVGRAHERLLNRLASLAPNKNPDSAPYWNVLPIMQSSGMGKSRTVDELAKMVFTIPICLREEQDGS